MEEINRIDMWREQMVSVIIPTYNREKTISRALESVQKQTYKDMEIIIVDDCSTDNTREVIEDYKDDCIRYIRHDVNKGACAARNTGIEVARGEYIAFQDSDDEWFPQKLETQMKKLEEENADICVTPLISCDIVKGTQEIHPVGGYADDVFNIEHFLGKSYVSTQVILAKKACFDDIMFDESLPRLQDWDLCIRLVSRYKFCYLKEPMAYQYIQSDSITSSDKKALDAYRIIYNKYKDEYVKYPKLRSGILETIAKWEYLCGEDSVVTLKEALSCGYSAKILIKYVLAKMNLLKLAYNILD